MYCSKCGKEIEDSVKVCPYCGTKNFKEDNEKIAALVIRMQGGDTSAFDELYFYMQKYVRYIAGGIIKNTELTEDVVQEVFISIYKNINSVKEPEKAKGWIKTITYNQALQTVKKEAKYVLLSEEEETDKFDNLVETDTFVMPGHALEQEDTQKLFMGFLDELPVKQKIALEGFYFDGKQIKQIAEETGISENTIKTSLRRGKMALAEKIEAWSKKTGEKLYTIPMAPVLYMLFRKEIDGSAVTSTLPAALASVIADITGKSAVAGATEVSAAKEVAGTVAKKAGAKAVAAKVIAGVAAVAVIGTGSYMYATKDERAIREVVADFTEACQNLDEEALRNCMSEETLTVMDENDVALTSQYLYSDITGEDINKETEFTLTISEVNIERDLAIVSCEYDAVNEVLQVEFPLIKEDRKWKLSMAEDVLSLVEMRESNMFYTYLTTDWIEKIINSSAKNFSLFNNYLSKDLHILSKNIENENVNIEFNFVITYKEGIEYSEQIRQEVMDKVSDGIIIQDVYGTLHFVYQNGKWIITDYDQIGNLMIDGVKFETLISWCDLNRPEWWTVL